MIKLSGIRKGFEQGDCRTEVLRDIDFTFERGKWYTIYGVSGSGKSTLLNVCGGLEIPDSGKILFDGIDIYSQSDLKLSSIRNIRIGFIFQFFHLIGDLNVYENILLPLNISGLSPDRVWLEEILDVLDIGGLTNRAPSTLSGGEQQRVAMARAIINRPDFVFADEPTGNLDSGNTEAVMRLLRKLKEQSGAGVILATHERDLAADGDIILRLQDGILKR